MSGSLQSILVGTSGLAAAGLLAILLTIRSRLFDDDRSRRERVVRLLLIALAAQSLHFCEEFVTRFQVRFPKLLDQPPWSDNFFVAFNLAWLSIWLLACAGLQRGLRMSLFPVWFFVIACIMNGIAHPVLSLLTHGYFPGLITSPLVGALGVLLWVRLQALTRRAPS